MNARVYDPSLGRFASADDRPSGSGNGQDWNTYAYVNNGPLSATDPTGHECLTCYGFTTGGFGGKISFTNIWLISSCDFVGGVSQGCSWKIESKTVSTMIGPAGAAGFGGSGGRGGNGPGGSGDGSGSGAKSPPVVLQTGKDISRQDDKNKPDGYCKLPDGSVHPFQFVGDGNVIVFQGNQSGDVPNQVGLGNAGNSLSMPTVDKPGGVGGGGLSGPVTSPASTVARVATRRARIGALKTITGTSSLGGSIDKIIPFIGSFLMLFDGFANPHGEYCAPLPTQA